MQSFQKKIIVCSFILAGIFCLPALALAKFDFVLGLILGTITAAGNFVLLGLKVEAVNSRRPNIIFIFAGLFLRYAIMAVVLWLATKISVAAFFGAALGLFMVRGGIYVFAWKEQSNRIEKN
ncbi:MAG: ATP synthase subunit I [Candidatus Omnitrophota bacterium]